VAKRDPLGHALILRSGLRVVLEHRGCALFVPQDFQHCGRVEALKAGLGRPSDLFVLVLAKRYEQLDELRPGKR
jgi:hypothetical protein